jgi:hypothetical protein
MKRAVYLVGAVEGPFFDSVGSWRCARDGQALVVVIGGSDPYASLAVVDLVLLRVEDGIRVYGLPDRSHARQKSRRGGTVDRREPAGVESPPFDVYCPRPGCGLRQRVG